MKFDGFAKSRHSRASSVIPTQMGIQEVQKLLKLLDSGSSPEWQEMGIETFCEIVIFKWLNLFKIVK